MEIMETIVTVRKPKMHQLKLLILIEQVKIKALSFYSLILSLIPDVPNLFQTHMNSKVMNLTKNSNNPILYLPKHDLVLKLYNFKLSSKLVCLKNIGHPIMRYLI